MMRTVCGLVALFACSVAVGAAAIAAAEDVDLPLLPLLLVVLPATTAPMFTAYAAGWHDVGEGGEMRAAVVCAFGAVVGMFTGALVEMRLIPAMCISVVAALVTVAIMRCSGRRSAGGPGIRIERQCRNDFRDGT